eukprot:2134266-Prorocentrum_lima.AAC.1
MFSLASQPQLIGPTEQQTCWLGAWLPRLRWKILLFIKLNHFSSKPSSSESACLPLLSMSPACQRTRRED